MGHGLDRRGLLAAAAGLAGATFVDVQATAQGRAVVNLQLQWFQTGAQIGELCAKYLGYYDAEGLELRVQAAGLNIDGLAVVAAGRSEAGQLSSSPALMLAVGQGIPVRCFAVGLQQHPFTYFSLKRNPVREPKDLVGKTLGTQGTAVILLRALLAKHGLAAQDVRVVATGADMSALLSGDVDVVSSWRNEVTPLRALGDQRVEMRLWDTGVRLYAHLYYASERTLKTQPQLLTRFLRATAKGWAFAHRQREQAVEFVLKAFPERNRRDEREAADIVLGYAFGPHTLRDGWGAMDRAVWQEQIDLYAGLKQFGARVPKVDDVMTLDVLKATEAERPRLG